MSLHFAMLVKSSVAALMAVTSVPGRAQTLEGLREVATLNTYAAPTAVYLLSNDLAPEGLVVLRQLYQSDSVVHPDAKQQLEGIAHHRGWN